jgi:glycyl-tRNA synthetase beta chain
VKAPGDQSAAPLLLEVGCEEIPARFLTEAQKDLAASLERALRETRLLGADAKPLESYSTPRRLVVYAPEVFTKQPDRVEELLGPPVRVALDAQGRPTRAAESFAEKNAARVEDLARVTTGKGEYLALRKTTQGRPAIDLLPEVLPSVITGLSFPKSLYWLAKTGPRFVRPIRWVLALVGEGRQAETVPFAVGGVKSGNFTYGHRALGNRALRVTNFKDYAKKLAAKHVQIDPRLRREAVVQESKVILEKMNLTLVPDEWLLDWIVNSCEWPRPLLGDFDSRFLRLPREILVTVMRDHQKYFAVEDARGALQPRFVAVLNLEEDARGVIRRGHERVLEARFSDAEFFWKADQSIRLEERGSLLARVTYEAELGSYADKVRRMKSIAAHLAAALEGPGLLTPAQMQHALRAVELAKCDLTTQMVQEFPELQGVVGGLYAWAQGEPEVVSEAIYDHYLPQSAEDRCPRSIEGAIVSLADKLDSMVGGFAVGHEATGSGDPFALRRHGNGIIKVLLEFKLPIRLKAAVEEALGLLEVQLRTSREEVSRRVLGFMEERLRFELETLRGFRYDTVRAVLAGGWDTAREALWRGQALESLRGSEDLEALCAAAKRIKNILSKSASSADWEPGEVDEALLNEDAERELYEAFRRVAAQAESFREAGEYRQALEVISSLRPAVDRFFDKVLVMAEDVRLRRNRLRLLGKLDGLFSGIARFAEIAAVPANVGAPASRTPGAEK